MAKCTIVGNTAIFMSDHSVETLKLVGERRPDSLCLSRTNEDGERDIFFRVATRHNEMIGQNGICFASNTVTADSAPRAIVNVEIPSDVEDPRKWVADRLGSTILNLRKVDAQVSIALSEIERENESILSSIDYVQI